MKKKETQKTFLRTDFRGENASDLIAIGFSYTFDWLKGKHIISEPIKEQCKAKLMQSRTSLDTKVELSLRWSLPNGSITRMLSEEISLFRMANKFQ